MQVCVFNVYFDFQGKVASSDTGRSLRLVEDNLQKHSHIEPQIKALSKRVSNINRRSHKFADLGQEAEFLDTRLADLNKYLEQ